MSSENELLIRINGTAKDFIEEVDKVKKKTEDLQSVLEDTAKYSAIAFAGFAASIALATKSFADYEKALVGVGKTTDMQGKELDAFGKKFQEMAGRIPVATNELLGIAQAAGQLGVRGEENLLKFTDTVAKLGVATDLSGEEAATALTRILTVTGEGVEKIDSFGSVIVALGNNFAATESEIVRVATEVSRSTAVFGTSAAEAAALAAALKSVGVQAELGGSAVGRAYRAIDSSIRQGGVALENLSKITGMTGEELRTTFAENSTAVFQKFIEGLGRISASGGDTTAALASFKLRGEEILKVLPVLAQNSELVGRALNMAAEETKNATALNEEARKAFDTLSSDVQVLTNDFTTLATNIGGKLAPDLRELVKGVSDIVKSFSDADGVAVSLIATFLKWGAAVAASIATVASAGIGYLTFQRVIVGLQAAFQASRLAVIGFTSAATLGLSVIIGFLPEIISFMGDLFKTMNKKPETESLDEITRKLEKLQELRERTAAAPNTGFQKNDAQLAALDEEIAKLKELQQEKIKASENFGTGEMLMRPEIEGGGFDPLAGIQAQTIPLAAPEDDPTVAAAREAEDEKVELANKAAAKRIESARLEYEKLKEMQELKNAEATQEEIDFAQRRLEIESERRAIDLLQNEEEKALRLESNRLKNEALLEQEAEYYMLKAELKAEEQAKDAELEAILNETKFAEMDQLNQKDLEQLRNKLETEKSTEKKYQLERLNAKIAERNQFLMDEHKFGTAIATMKQFFHSQEMQNFQSGTQQLVQLTNSRNETMKGIGKAASSVQAAIATGEGAIKAYSAMAGIPIVGPALGAAAAAAVIAYGAEQQANILAANEGGQVPFSFGSTPGIDSVPAMLTPGELVVPENSYEDVVNDAADRKLEERGETSRGSGGTVVIQGDFYGEEAYIDFLADKLFDAQKNRNVQLVPEKV